MQLLSVYSIIMGWLGGSPCYDTILSVIYCKPNIIILWIGTISINIYLPIYVPTSSLFYTEIYRRVEFMFQLIFCFIDNHGPGPLK